MQTPAGKECKFFYGDYYRGRQQEECRLLSSISPPLTWNPGLCQTCPVPEIQLANACESLILMPRIERSFPLGKRRVRISTTCSGTLRKGFDAHIGCGECHQLPQVFAGEDL